MRIRIHWVPAVIYCSLTIIISSFGGLAGFFSFWISYFLPLYAVIVVVYIGLSWHWYAWHQEFSTSHPHKGENIYCSLRLSNDGPIPLVGGSCLFTVPGKEDELSFPAGILARKKRTKTYETIINCPYRGTYTAGITAVKLTTPLGILETKITIMPQTFYVYPELCELDASVEKYAISSGVTLPESGKGATDSAIFEYATQLRGELPGARIAWKRWAATGIPTAIITGQARSQGLTIVLDLFPCDCGKNAVTEEEKLAAEDTTISAAFSVMQYLALHEIPVTFITGSSINGLQINSSEVFWQLYERSTGILFTDPAFPIAAFTEDSSALLFSTRPIAELYGAYEHAVHAGIEPHLFLCPPPSTLEAERQHAELVQEQRSAAGCRSLFRIADVRNGTREIIDAFKI